MDAESRRDAARFFAQAIGPEARDALADETVEDLFAGPDGGLFALRREVAEQIGTLSVESREAAIAYAGAFLQAGATAKRPVAEVTVPYGEKRVRFAGMLPPISEGPEWNLRNTKLLPLVDLAAWHPAPGQVDALLDRVGERNLLIVGAPRAGKSSLLGALLNSGAYAGRFVPVCEDRREVTLAHPSLTPSWLTDPFAEPEPIDLGKLARYALSRGSYTVIIGEARGPEALAIQTVWNTLPGGLATIHATSARGAIQRMCDLIAMNAGVRASRAEVMRAVQSIAVVVDEGGRRRLEGVYDVEAERDEVRKVA